MHPRAILAVRAPFCRKGKSTRTWLASSTDRCKHSEKGTQYMRPRLFTSVSSNTESNHHRFGRASLGRRVLHEQSRMCTHGRLPYRVVSSRRWSHAPFSAPSAPRPSKVRRCLTKAPLETSQCGPRIPGRVRGLPVMPADGNGAPRRRQSPRTRGRATDVANKSFPR